MNRVLIGLLILAVAFLGFNSYQGFAQNIRIEVVDFETCAAKTGEVMESHPRQCRYEGKTYVEELVTEEHEWENDGIDLAKVKEDGSYACFGCSSDLCVDPVIDAIDWVDETHDRYCSDQFQVIER